MTQAVSSRYDTALFLATAQLRKQVRGQIITPEDPEYAEACLCWNRSVNQHPALILVAQSAEDVAAAVKFARQNDLGVAVQATGHGNVRPADDCLLILTREMNGIVIDKQPRAATVQAGVRWGAVLSAAQQHGLAPLLGSSPSVGAVGYTLGGGLGWLARKYGLSTDNVLQFNVVTADGQQRTASISENSDLFWGLRGGGGSLAIVTSMTIRLVPVTTVYAGNLFYPASMAREVFQRFREWAAIAPDELTSSVLVMNFPPIPAIPEFLRGQSFAIVRGCYCGELVDGEKHLHFWRSWRAPQVDDFKAIPFSAAASISSDPVDPIPGFTSGAWLSGLSDSSIDALVEYTLGIDGPGPLTIAEVRHAGGAIHRAAPNATVIGNRDAEFVLALIGMAPTHEARQHLVEYTDALKARLSGDLTGGVYMNFIDREESRQRIRDGLVPGGYERLAQLKARYDPDNLFGYSFNVAPSA